MTPAQITRIQTKIIQLRKILAAERARFGGYDDSAGRRNTILNCMSALMIIKVQPFIYVGFLRISQIIVVFLSSGLRHA
jgi:hypothetical protein